MKTFLLPIILLAFVSAVHAAAAADISIADFEGGDYGTWVKTGEAFGPGPAAGTLAGQMAVSGFEGKGLVNSFFNGDKTTGTLTGPEFKIDRKFINFLVGGGNHPAELQVNLLVDGKAARTQSGINSEHLEWATWNVSDLAGKMAKIEIIDKHTGGWGHINVDSIAQSDERKAEEIKADVMWDETYRPQFHFTAPKNWLNDPNGLVFYKGGYHLFYQHNPSGINWGNMSWGHATSTDLIHWKNHPIALLPDENGTCFSGSAVVDWNNTSGFQKGDEKPIVLLYTGAPIPQTKESKKFTQCLAYSTDGGKTFSTYKQNPVIPHISSENRDPKVVWHEQTKKWILALYYVNNEFAFFSSPNLKEWKEESRITVPGSAECPDFFPMTQAGPSDKTVRKWVWTAADGHYLIGDFDGHVFKPNGPRQRSDWGRNYYAVQTYSDIPEADGRRIQVAWMNGGSYPQMPFNQQMNFPCEMTMHSTPEGLRIFRNPVREIEKLRIGQTKWDNQDLREGTTKLSAVNGELWDINAEIELGEMAEVGFRIRGQHIVSYNIKDQKLSSLGSVADLKPMDGRLKLRILVDRSSVETFGNDGRVVISNCFLPKQKEKGLEIFIKGGQGKMISLHVHELKSGWKEN